MTTRSMVSPEIESPMASRTTTDSRSATESHDADDQGLRGRMSRLVESGKARAIEWKGGVQDGIRERPVQSVLIAAAVGAVIGLIVGRRSR
jgi:ElaB/YqjD/DUF883 family membrane-anchored ribosome-binding protein